MTGSFVLIIGQQMKMENSGRELDVSPKQDLFMGSLYYVEI